MAEEPNIPTAEVTYMADSVPTAPIQRLSRQELRILTELALKAQVSVADGYNLRFILENAERIINSQFDLVSDTRDQTAPQVPLDL